LRLRFDDFDGPKAGGDIVRMGKDDRLSVLKGESQPEDSVFEIRELVYTYADGTPGLRGVTASLPRGRMIAVLGANGAGKTTLFMHLLGVHRPTAGTVSFRGKPLSYGHRELKALRREVGMVFQDPEAQLFSASVYQDVSFGPLNLGLREGEVRQRVDQALTAVGLTGLAERPTHALSHGEKKRAALAGVLAMKPKVLVCDEPTAGLDPQGAILMADLLRRLRDDGITVVFSTHDVDLAWNLADHCLVLAEGCLLEAGPPEAVFQDDALLERAGLTRPWVLDFFTEAYRRGLAVEAPPPRNQQELLDTLEQGARIRNGLETGRDGVKATKTGEPRIYALYKKPMTGAEVEAESFRRIEAEAPAHSFSAGEWAVVRRLIHTTADFGLLGAVHFSGGAVEAGITALRRGAPLYADANMIRAGLSLARLRWAFAGYTSEDIHCTVADPAVAAEAQAAGLPRSLFAVRRARPFLGGGIVLIGNAPVALLELNRMIREGEIRPALVVGMPVGFVHVEESKQELMGLDVPWICVAGRRGGSSLAVATLHALAILAGGNGEAQ